MWESLALEAMGHYSYVESYLTIGRGATTEYYIGVAEEAMMLELKGLCKHFRGIPAVEDVSFRLAAGEIVGFLGPNGAGKSTTVKMITGMLRPDAGRVCYEGHDIRDDMVAFRRAIGYVPEEAHLYGYMSGLEYLQLVGRLRGFREALIEAKATGLLKLLHLESSQHSPIATYSKGMRQRVLIAAALLHDPRLLIFDEPLSGLDVISARLLKDLLELLAAQGKAVLYISHVLEVVEQVCHRVVVMARGRILADARPSELTQLMRLPNLESVFAQLIQQQDTAAVARQIVEVMRNDHA